MARRVSYHCRFCQSECCHPLLKPHRSLWLVCGRCGAAVRRTVGPLLAEWKAGVAGLLIVMLGLAFGLVAALGPSSPSHLAGALWSAPGLALASLILLTAALGVWALTRVSALTVGRWAHRRAPRA